MFKKMIVFHSYLTSWQMVCNCLLLKSHLYPLMFPYHEYRLSSEAPLKPNVIVLVQTPTLGSTVQKGMIGQNLEVHMCVYIYTLMLVKS